MELPIPTYYGDEICRVNGMKYAKDVVLATLQNVAAPVAACSTSAASSRDATQDNAHYDLKLGYASSHQFALDAVPPGAAVIDIGAGPGGIASELVEEGLPGGGRRSVRPDARRSTPTSCVFTPGPGRGAARSTSRGYDYLLLLDVIEHLKNPERFLDRLRAQFDYSPRTLILTTPNIAFVVQRLMLLFGQFNYGKAGILDRTHTRLFTFRSLRQLLVDAGFRIKEIRGVPAPFPKVLGNGMLGRAATGGQPAADPRQPVAVLVSDLRDRRGDAGRRLHPAGCQAARPTVHDRAVTPRHRKRTTKPWRPSVRITKRRPRGHSQAPRPTP